ncbi:MAG: hypothetical protein EPN86_03190 [Nanoarchaeota archaeon]|nr:MAG: hypothetical protein EPN86_03190 [Nanoarchaeota archaeon]
MKTTKKINPNILIGISLMLTILSVIFYRRNHFLFISILGLALVADAIVKKIRFRKMDLQLKLADLTGNRLSEALLFSVAWYPWFFIYVLNCLLTLYSLLKKQTLSIPLRYIFLAHYIAMLALGKI